MPALKNWKLSWISRAPFQARLACPRGDGLPPPPFSGKREARRARSGNRLLRIAAFRNSARGGISLFSLSRNLLHFNRKQNFLPIRKNRPFYPEASPKRSRKKIQAAATNATTACCSPQNNPAMTSWTPCLPIRSNFLQIILFSRAIAVRADDFNG